MREFPQNLQNAIIKHGFTVVKLSNIAKYEVGKKYWSGVWEKWFEVLAVEYNGRYLKEVIIRWENGAIVKHNTDLNPTKDYELRYK